MTESEVSFACDSCGKAYRWKPQLAGRRVKCGCGGVMSVPQAPPRDEDVFDLVDSEPSRAPAFAAPVMTPAPVATASLAYARSDTQDSAVDRYFPDRIKDLYMPLVLIGGGTLIELVHAAITRGPRSAPVAVATMGIAMVVNTIIMLIGISLVAKLRGINFGPLLTALLKLCAISIGPGAAGTLASAALTFIPFSGIFGFIASFLLYFALIGALFDLDESDTWACVLTIFFLRLAVVAAIMWFWLK